jgi:signal peptidase I
MSDQIAGDPLDLAAPAETAPEPAPPERDAAALPPRVPAHHHHVGVLPTIQSALYVLVIALFFMTFTVQPIRIPSSSMEPTLLVGDFLLLDRQATSGDDVFWMPPTGVRRGDVVVFHDPVDDPSVHLVKRVIGLPGDRIHLRNNVVYVNGRPLKEPYAVYRASAPDGFRDDFPNLAAMDGRVDAAWWIRLRNLVRDGELTVPKGDFFVLGDNRNDSDDSRYWGFVPQSYIVGEPVLVYFSWRDRDPAKNEPFARWDRFLHVVR